MVLHEVECLDWANSADIVGVVAATQDAEVDEFYLVHFKALKHLRMINLSDRVFFTVKASQEKV